MGDNAYTPEEVANILKISRYTVYELIKRGELTAYHIGRKVRVEPADLDRYIQNAKGCPPALTRTTVQAVAAATPEQSLVICGQDPVLDILTRHLEKNIPNLRFLRHYIGSIPGLLELYHGTAGLVTAHLWDGDTDDYNTPYVRRLLPGHHCVLCNLVYRWEGFYVAAGNPKAVRTWTDLTRPEIRFVNRECGSGARVLLDEQLRRLNIEHQAVQGYEREETSHLTVASYVARGEADLGLGTEKAALQVRGIEFIPLQKERYDLVLRRDDIKRPHFQVLLSLLRSPAFQNEVSGMGGYDISKMGQIMAEV